MSRRTSPGDPRPLGSLSDPARRDSDRPAREDSPHPNLLKRPSLKRSSAAGRRDSWSSSVGGGGQSSQYGSNSQQDNADEPSLKRLRQDLAGQLSHSGYSSRGGVKAPLPSEDSADSEYALRTTPARVRRGSDDPMDHPMDHGSSPMGGGHMVFGVGAASSLSARHARSRGTSRSSDGGPAELNEAGGMVVNKPRPSEVGLPLNSIEEGEEVESPVKSEDNSSQQSPMKVEQHSPMAKMQAPSPLPWGDASNSPNGQKTKRAVPPMDKGKKRQRSPSFGDDHPSAMQMFHVESPCRDPAVSIAVGGLEKKVWGGAGGDHSGGVGSFRGSGSGLLFGGGEGASLMRQSSPLFGSGSLFGGKGASQSPPLTSSPLTSMSAASGTTTSGAGASNGSAGGGLFGSSSLFGGGGGGGGGLFGGGAGGQKRKGLGLGLGVGTSLGGSPFPEKPAAPEGRSGFAWLTDLPNRSSEQASQGAAAVGQRAVDPSSDSGGGSAAGSGNEVIFPEQEGMGGKVGTTTTAFSAKDVQGAFSAFSVKGAFKGAGVPAGGTVPVEEKGGRGWIFPRRRTRGLFEPGTKKSSACVLIRCPQSWKWLAELGTRILGLGIG